MINSIYRLSYVLGFLFFALCMQADVLAQSNDDPDKLEKEQLEQLQKTISDLKKQLAKTKSSRDSIAKSLEQSEKNIGELSKKAKKLESSLNNEKNKLKSLRDERTQLNKKKHQQQNLVGGYINAAYRVGQKSQLHLLLNQQSPADLSRTLKYYDYFIEARADKIQDYLGTIDRIDKIEPEITASTTKLGNQIAQLKTQQQKIHTAQANRQITLAKLNSQVKDTSSEINKLLADQKRLENLVTRVSGYIGDVDASNTGDVNISKLKGQLPWPTKGKILNRFGSQRVDRMKWQGIRIGGDRGAEIFAVHAGRVVFSDYLRGHGLLLILDHGSGFMSLYAHNQTLYKDLGEWVSGGDIIASLGDSGGQTSTALYFELRRNGQPTNPLRWLKSV